MRAPRTAGSRGLILYETLAAVFALTVAIVVFVPVMVLTMKASRGGEETVVALHLAQELLDEIRLRLWDKNTRYPPVYTRNRSPIGIDPSEGETATDKTGWDDVDDFNGWTESPPQDPMGNPMPQFAGYTRTVVVEYVQKNSNANPRNTFVLVSAGGKTDYKHIKVCVQPPNKQFRPTCLETIKTNR